eukprot:4423054-Amphidinium_carterae.1
MPHEICPCCDHNGTHCSVSAMLNLLTRLSQEKLATGTEPNKPQLSQHLQPCTHEHEQTVSVPALCLQCTSAKCCD